MYKRISIRLVRGLAEKLEAIAKSRGLSLNSLITEMAWDFAKSDFAQMIRRSDSREDGGQ